MADVEIIPVSPRHSVLLAEEYLTLIQTPPRQDFVVRTIQQRTVGNLPLMSAELVIASAETREHFPLAAEYPLHFRKTYFPSRMHANPENEMARHVRACELLNLAPPIGYTSTTFRTCLVPGTPYSRLSPFGISPVDGNIWRAQKLPLESAAGLWKLAEEAFCQLERLHAGGLCHGDAELHNFIVCPSPLELIPIDFESSVEQTDVTDEEWEKKKELDLAPFMTEAVYIQCALGRQPSRLGELSYAAIEHLFDDPERFRRAIDEQARLGQ